MVVTIPHELGRAEARRRIDGGVAQLTQQLGAIGNLRQSWDGDVLKFELSAIGQMVTGAIAVADREVRIEIVLPGIFAMIAGKVKARMQREGQVLLEGPKTGR